MTLLTTSRFDTTDAIRVLSAVGDVFSGHTIGFGMTVANIATRFAVYRERPGDVIAATFYAAALHQIGSVSVVVPRDASERDARIARWDDPPAGAVLVASTGMFTTATADAIRWHREAFDGTGFPDRLRWNGIPDTSMSINIVRAFVEAREAHGEFGSAADAVFMLVEDSGCVFTLAAMREFREFLAAEAETYDLRYEPFWARDEIDPHVLVTRICAEIDDRLERTTGRGDRLEKLVRAIAGELGDAAVDADRAAFAVRLTALSRTGPEGGADDAFTLSRLGLEARAEQAATAARILRTAPTFAPLADIVGSTEEWYDGSGLPYGRAANDIDPIARVLAVAIAADAVTAGDAELRIRAAAGSRLDPAMVRAYIAAGVRR